MEDSLKVKLDPLDHQGLCLLTLKTNEGKITYRFDLDLDAITLKGYRTELISHLSLLANGFDCCLHLGTVQYYVIYVHQATITLETHCNSDLIVNQIIKFVDSKAAHAAGSKIFLAIKEYLEQVKIP